MADDLDTEVQILWDVECRQDSKMRIARKYGIKRSALSIQIKNYHIKMPF